MDGMDWMDGMDAGKATVWVGSVSSIKSMVSMSPPGPGFPPTNHSGLNIYRDRESRTVLPEPGFVAVEEAFEAAGETEEIGACLETGAFFVGDGGG
jgi:hypothetical protein